jgi:hypothetical protein
VVVCSMRKITVGRAGHVALVDDEDYELVSQYQWCRKTDKQGMIYARRKYPPTGDGVQRYQLMHSLITGLSYVDHIDRDGLNNQRSNLRTASHAQNMQNRRWAAGSSQYKGVCWHRRIGKWQAYTAVSQPGGNGRKIHLGYFQNEEEAARAYDAAARERFGEFAYLNFPGEVS